MDLQQRVEQLEDLLMAHVNEVERHRQIEAVELRLREDERRTHEEEVGELARFTATMHERCEVQQEEIHGLRAQLSVLSKKRMLTSGEVEGANTSQSSEETEAEKRPASMFVYCCWRLGQPLSTMALIRVYFHLLILTSAQIILVYAYFDAAALTQYLENEYIAFQLPVNMINFYWTVQATCTHTLRPHNRRLAFRWLRSPAVFSIPRVVDHVQDGAYILLEGDAQPTVNVVASLVAIVMLGVIELRREDVQTLRSVPPFERLIVHSLRTDVPIAMKIREALYVVPVQICWAVRAYFVPAMGVLGSAINFASSNTATDMCAPRPLPSAATDAAIATGALRSNACAALRSKACSWMHAAECMHGQRLWLTTIDAFLCVRACGLVARAVCSTP